MLVESLNIPDAWHEALISHQAHDPTAIIAGGAIRDLSYGVEPKDVDIFTTAVPPTWEQTIGEGMDYKGMQYVRAVLCCKHEGLEYQVIIIEPTPWEKLLQSFDLGFCQIGYDGKQILRTPEFLWDQKYNTITLRHIDRYQRSLKRWARINKRYGMDITIPQLQVIEVAGPSPEPVF